MRFLLSRSSEGAVSTKAPCKGAVRGPEAAAWPGQFQWYIDVDTLDDLMALLDRTGGGLGLFLPEEGEDHPVIEIFDEDEDEG